MKSSLRFKILVVLSAVSGLSYMIFSVVIHMHIRNMTPPESYIGMTNLIEIRDYLLTYFWLNIADIILYSIFIILLILLSMMTAGGELKFKAFKFWWMLVLVSGLGNLTLMDNQINKFDFQQNANQYQGTILMQTHAFLKDIEQDLQNNTTRTVTCVPEWDSRISSGYDEYALYDSASDDYLSQISKKDYDKISRNFCGYLSHEFKLYTHSGLIASVDNNIKIQTPDYENLFTIKFENNTIYRTTHPEEEQFKNLFLITVMDNKQEKCDALQWTEKAFPFSYDAKKCSAYLAIPHQNTLVPVSNTVSFSYNRYTGEFTFIE